MKRKYLPNLLSQTEVFVSARDKQSHKVHPLHNNVQIWKGIINYTLADMHIAIAFDFGKFIMHAHLLPHAAHSTFPMWTKYLPVSAALYPPVVSHLPFWSILAVTAGNDLGCIARSAYSPAGSPHRNPYT